MPRALIKCCLCQRVALEASSVLRVKVCGACRHRVRIWAQVTPPFVLTSPEIRARDEVAEKLVNERIKAASRYVAPGTADRPGPFDGYFSDQ